MNHDESAVEVVPESKSAEMIRAMNIGVRNALREHKRLGQSIIVWDHGNKKVVEIPAEEIVVPEVDEVDPKGERP